jgi:hypothetical protein
VTTESDPGRVGGWAGQEKVACRCGFLTRPGPFCEKCGSPLNLKPKAAEAAGLRPARKPPPAPLPTIPIHQGGGSQPEAPAEGLLCTWCGAISRPGPGCEACGSPIETGNLVSQEDVRFESGEKARPDGEDHGHLRLITPPPEEPKKGDEEDAKPGREVGA